MSTYHYALIDDPYGKKAYCLQSAYHYTYDEFQQALVDIKRYGELHDVISLEELNRVTSLDHVLGLGITPRTAIIKKWLDVPRLYNIIAVDIDKINANIQKCVKQYIQETKKNPCIYPQATIGEAKNPINDHKWEIYLDFVWRHGEKTVSFIFGDEDNSDKSQWVLDLELNGDIKSFHKACH